MVSLPEFGYSIVVSWINSLKSEKGRHHLVPLHLNLFVKLSIILSAGGSLLMIDAAPLNVMDERYMMGRGWVTHPCSPPPSTPRCSECKGDASPVVRRHRDKGTFNLSPINNVQLRRPFAKGALQKLGHCCIEAMFFDRFIISGSVHWVMSGNTVFLLLHGRVTVMSESPLELLCFSAALVLENMSKRR